MEHKARGLSPLDHFFWRPYSVLFIAKLPGGFLLSLYALQASDASPQDQHLSLWIRTRAIASYIDGDYASAARYAVEATAKRPDWFFNYYCSAACHAAAGDLTAARRNVDQAKTFGPYPMQALRVGHPFADRKLFEQFVGHLTLAGWAG